MIDTKNMEIKLSDKLYAILYFDTRNAQEKGKEI